MKTMKQIPHLELIFFFFFFFFFFFYKMQEVNLFYFCSAETPGSAKKIKNNN